MASVEKLWAEYQASGSWPVLSELIYTLYEAAAEDGFGVSRALWEVTQLRQDADGKFLPRSTTWGEFVRDHLRMHKSTACRYKRIWEVYRIRLGYDVKELTHKGVFALAKAVATVDRLWKAGSDELVVVLDDLFEHLGRQTYFIVDERGRVKIGVSSNVIARRDVLQGGNADRLTLLYCIDGDKELEFHSMFEQSHICGEWFNFSHDIAQFLVNSGCDEAWCAGAHGWGYGDYVASFAP